MNTRMAISSESLTKPPGTVHLFAQSAEQKRGLSPSPRRFCEGFSRILAVASLFAAIAMLLPCVDAADVRKSEAANSDVPRPDAPKAEPKRIKQKKDGSIGRPARDLVVHGTTVRYEPDKNTIGYWLKKEDWVGWDLEVVTPGTFN